MNSNTVKTEFLIGGISVSVLADDGDVIKKAKDKMKRAGVSPSTLHFRLYKRSVDARRRDDVRFVCTVLASSEKPRDAFPITRLRDLGIKLVESKKTETAIGTEKLNNRPLVVGMGPAGLFAALSLAKHGYAPILIDRGSSVEERAKKVERFRKEGILDTESNIQFGAGGAGTFSDGKLVTRINDVHCNFVLETMCEFGAPEEILIKSKPHVGTDLLRTVVSEILSEIEQLGGSVIYDCCMTDFVEHSDGSLNVKTTKGDFLCDALFLALGHSSRDTYTRLIQKNFASEPKPFSVGVRIEHLQSDIDSALYGKFAGNPKLGPAEYALSDTRGERGVYTFCMCPGGEVVAAASEHEGLVVNGMSYHARNGKNANCAVLASVGCEDVEPVNGNAALGAIALQRQIERAAFVAGGKDYYAPIMTVGDFLNGGTGSVPTRVQPSYRDGLVRPCRFDEVFPSFVTRALQYGIRSFGRKISGFDADDAVLTAAETRTSAPLRILRDTTSLTAIGHDRIFPCGEGAGYAGGITSAAVDGLRAAEAFMARFAPMN
ncbi:MAG: hypothetical protein IJW16_06645 [Clostridia bacterium]|nr:hypothetical protein [Clostridia bacterium]